MAKINREYDNNTVLVFYVVNVIDFKSCYVKVDCLKYLCLKRSGNCEIV